MMGILCPAPLDSRTILFLSIPLTLVPSTTLHRPSNHTGPPRKGLTHECIRASRSSTHAEVPCMGSRVGNMSWDAGVGGCMRFWWGLSLSEKVKDVESGACKIGGEEEGGDWEGQGRGGVRSVQDRGQLEELDDVMAPKALGLKQGSTRNRDCGVLGFTGRSKSRGAAFCVPSFLSIDLFVGRRARNERLCFTERW
jgi:hypothetical protein